MELLSLSLNTIEHVFLDLRPLSKSRLLTHIVLAEALTESISDMVAVAIEADLAMNAMSAQQFISVDDVFKHTVVHIADVRLAISEVRTVLTDPKGPLSSLELPPVKL